jgi:hypothetical protein
MDKAESFDDMKAHYDELREFAIKLNLTIITSTPKENTPHPIDFFIMSSPYGVLQETDKKNIIVIKGRFLEGMNDLYSARKAYKNKMLESGQEYLNHNSYLVVNKDVAK